MKVLGGIVLIVLAGIWLLRGILTVLVTTGPTQGGAVTGVVLAGLLLTVGIIGPQAWAGPSGTFFAPHMNPFMFASGYCCV
jgi:hypothetical protein